MDRRGGGGVNAAYLLLVGGGAVLCAVLMNVRLRQQGMKWLPILPGVLLGAVLAKVGYVLLQWHYAYPRWGFSAFLKTQADTFCFLTGAIGVVLGVALSARLRRMPVLKALDAFAPAGALLAAVARFAEKHLDLLGTAGFEMPESLSFFPFALTNDWGESYPAVFMLSFLACLIVSAFAFLARREGRPGALFLRTSFYLALPQIMMESLLAECMKWGFVRVQQVLCAVVLLAVLIAECRRCEKGTFLHAWVPLMVLLLCVAGLVGVEFALDKSGLPAYVGYGAMAVLLIAIAVAECIAHRHESV